MKQVNRYYLIAEGKNPITIRVSDSLDPGRTVLMELEAESYSQAVKMVSFSVRNMGKAAICGVKPNGEPYAEVID